MTSYYLNERKQDEIFGTDKIEQLVKTMLLKADHDFDICTGITGGLRSLTIYDDETVHKGLSVSVFENTIRKFGYKGTLVQVANDSGWGE
jgi:hypothetical protein